MTIFDCVLLKYSLKVYFTCRVILKCTLPQYNILRNVLSVLETAVSLTIVMPRTMHTFYVFVFLSLSREF